jgi:pimeloyl-ACP methyl ester carboxylesterase
LPFLASSQKKIDLGYLPNYHNITLANYHITTLAHYYMTNILKRNNVNVIGEGEKVIVFAHGFGCDQNVWASLIKEFSADYKLLL